ncbi:pyridoxamine 5'-phosphate oxidase family protein [Clostridiales bacterium COT073_COT-073]|nr:pyridoxamine 5'-phosphate oxidase family protein [Clostridiales bacterium COT073_COT-073]
MTIKENFLRIMCTHTEMALATSTYSQPNIRVVNFYYDEEERKIFFTSFENKDKIREFEINPKVAFTTIPPQRAGREHVKAKGVVRKSSKSIYAVKSQFAQKVADYGAIIDEVGEHLVLFEIVFDTATVTLSFEDISVLEMKKWDA